MECEYCVYRNSWDCDDGWNRIKNCSDFKLDWDMISDEDKESIRKLLNKEEEYNCHYTEVWY